MNEFDVTSILSAVDFGPSSEQLEIAQNVRTILATRVGTVPLDREFGLPWDDLDGPHSLVTARFTAAIVEAIETNEPRVKVTQVTFDGNDRDGVLRPRVRVRRA
jgi:phage baseplate assembly protein W